ANLVKSAETLQWFFEFRGWFQEGAELFGTTAEALRQLAPALNEAQQHGLGQMLGHHTYLVTRLGAYEVALTSASESIALLEGSGDNAALAHSLMYRGMALLHIGDYMQARQDLQKSLALAEKDDHVTRFFCETWSGVLAHAMGDYAEAEA